MPQDWPEPEENRDPVSDTLFAEVILPFSLPNTYTYRVPAEWNGWIQTGQRVVVPFGKKKYYSGLVTGLGHTPPKGYEAKYVHSLLDESPLVDELHLKFWNWLAAYYLCNLGDVMAAALPAGLKMASETRIIPNPDTELQTTDLSDPELTLMEVLQRREIMSITEAQELCGIRNIFPVIKALYHKNLVLTAEEISERYKPRTKPFIRLADTYQQDDALAELLDSLERRAPKQADVVLKYLANNRKREWADKLQLQKSGEVSAAAIKSLIDKGVLELVEKRVDRLDTFTEGSLVLKLDETQQQAANQVESFWQEKEVVLLHGITGSGKSYVFFELIRKQLDEGFQVLYLLPEIALTVQLVGKLRALFGNKVLISHSRFNENERVEVYKKVAEGEPCVVIGARSSLFLAFRNLGLVIVDEEHDASFKQYDPAPRYQARDAAIMLAHLAGARVLLGSATPSLESYYNAKSGKYGLVRLDRRYGDAVLPEIELIDLGEMIKSKRMQGSFSKPLIEKIEAGIQAHKQVILFQNRKGYVPIILCNNCGWTLKCVSCDISLTYYKSTDMMRCHYCGYSQRPVKSCPTCGSAHLEMSGFGTELIEEELHLKHPEFRIARFDQSSIRGKHAHHRIVHEFEEHELDVLVGTQMLAKGLDFEGVNLVGVMQADQLLNFPHFRSHERAFQLLTQVSGRAGRREEKGQVLIQTFRTGHPVLKQVIRGDYEDFYAAELAERERFNYPPFSKLIEVHAKSLDVGILNEGVEWLATEMKKRLGSRVLGPETPYVSRIRNFHLRRILIKLEREKLSHLKIKQDLRSLLEEFHTYKKWRTVKVHFDVDPA